MSFISNNITDLYTQNGLMELTAGLITMLAPWLMFYGIRTNPYAVLIARWWAAAVICIGFSSLLETKIPDECNSLVPISNIGRQYAGIGYLIYHVFLTIFHTPLGDPQKVRSNLNTWVGFAVHLYFLVRFIMELHVHGTFGVVESLFLS